MRRRSDPATPTFRPRGYLGRFAVVAVRRSFAVRASDSDGLAIAGRSSLAGGAAAGTSHSRHLYLRRRACRLYGWRGGREGKLSEVHCE